MCRAGCHDYLLLILRAPDAGTASSASSASTAMVSRHGPSRSRPRPRPPPPLRHPTVRRLSHPRHQPLCRQRAMPPAPVPVLCDYHQCSAHCSQTSRTSPSSTTTRVSRRLGFLTKYPLYGPARPWATHATFPHSPIGFPLLIALPLLSRLVLWPREIRRLPALQEPCSACRRAAGAGRPRPATPLPRRVQAAQPAAPAHRTYPAPRAPAAPATPTYARSPKPRAGAHGRDGHRRRWACSNCGDGRDGGDRTTQTECTDRQGSVSSAGQWGIQTGSDRRARTTGAGYAVCTGEPVDTWPPAHDFVTAGAGHSPEVTHASHYVSAFLF